MKHKHADLIHAWADGAQIQIRCSPSDKWANAHSPFWDADKEYRIKPMPKPDVVRNITVEATSRCGEEFVQVFKSGKYCFPNLHLTFDGETGKLKLAEVL
jgi:hypothetical protein